MSYNSLSYKFKQLNAGEQLMIVNIVVFVILWMLALVPSIGQQSLTYYLGLNNHWSEVVTRPWTLMSYAFVHHTLSHLFWNMVLLYFTSTVFFNLFDNKRFLKIYFLGGLCAAVLFLLISHFSPWISGDVYLVGASACIIAVLLFVCIYVPNYKVYLPFNIRLDIWILGAIVLGVDLLQMNSGNAGGHIAHIGGALFGGLYALSIKYQRHLPSFSWKRKNLTRPSKNHTAKRIDINDKDVLQRKIDYILDKINRNGYENLSKAEKDFLSKLK